MAGGKSNWPWPTGGGGSGALMAGGKDGKSSWPWPPDGPPDNALHSLGMEFTTITAGEVVGRLLVTATCCQPFKVLGGGVSALMAEASASIGGYIASGYRRVAGVQMSINHMRSAHLGETVQAQAKPIHLGRTLQVWEVEIWRIDPSTSECKDLVSTARVTLLCNLPTPEDLKHYEQDFIKKHAKL
uniref:Thioesterase domain-containing protein n=1 Tax=Oryza brachyantha TaxID=4533 RepID=J3M3S9_ORYBR